MDKIGGGRWKAFMSIFKSNRVTGYFKSIEMTQASKPTTEIAKGIFLVIALSVVLVWVSHSITFTHVAESVFNQYATVRGEPFIFDGKPLVIHPFYNRLLFPSVFVVCANIFRGWTDIQLFIFLRFFSFVLCLSFIYIAAYRRSNFSNQDAMTVCSALALSMIPTFNHGWVHTSDIFDLTICLFMFLYIAEDKFVPAFLVACLTIINRETGAFAAIAYICIVIGTQKLSVVVLRAAMIGLVPYLGAILVRKLVLGDQLPLMSSGQWYIGLSYNLDILIEALKRPSPIGWVMLLVGMATFPLLVFLKKKSDQIFKVRVIVAFLAVFAISGIVGISSEVRTFIPCIGLLIGCALAQLNEPKPLFLDGSSAQRSGST
jgi:hypothetical protein